MKHLNTILHLIRQIFLSLALHLFFCVNKAQCAKKKLHGSDNQGDQQAADKREIQADELAMWIANNPKKTYCMVLVGQIIFAVSFSLYFKYKYIHHPDNANEKYRLRGEDETQKMARD